jgi:glyoxylase-like metal-dependent hydrolase (beta-lactamase superfamily II)
MKPAIRITTAAMLAALLAVPTLARETADARVTALADALGGRATLSELDTVQITAVGETFVPSSSHIPGGPNISGTSYRTITTIDLRQRRLRFEAQRDISFNLWEMRPNPKTKYVERIVGDRGYVEGVDNIIQLPSRPLLPESVAAQWRQQLYLNPQLIVRELLAGTRKIASVARSGGATQYTVTDSIAPVVLTVQDGKLVSLETTELRPDFRDTALRVRYTNWTDSSPAFPATVEIALDGAVVLTEQRRLLAGTKVSDADFDIPANAVTQFQQVVASAPIFVSSWYGLKDASGVPALFEATPEFIAWGQRSSQFILAFGNVGVPFAGRDRTLVPQPLAEGVIMLFGSTHHSVLVEQANGVVLLEAPLSPERSAAIEAFAATVFPGKRITHVVVTHHHFDHVAGVRHFVARGATIVTSALNADYLARLFARRSTLDPDLQATRPQAPRFERVGLDASVTLPDSKRPIVVHAINTRQAADLILPYLPQQKTVFVADVYSPPFPPLSATEFTQFASELERLKLDVQLFAGAHVAIADRATFEKTLAEVRAQANRSN